MKEFPNTFLYQSTSTTCRDDWWSIHKDGLQIGHKDYRNFTWTLKGKGKVTKVIYWRYGVEIGKLIIAKQFDPVFYFRYVREPLVHEAHYQQLICPQYGCKNKDLSFIRIGKHNCNTIPRDNSSNCLIFRDKSYYANKYVVLTFTRVSGDVVHKTTNEIDMTKCTR